jgi:aspartate racemase
MGGVVGVLGGMGPLATVDFLQKIIEETKATRDQDHIPVVVSQIPQIPDRVGAILNQTESPLPALIACLQRLERAGADAIVIACNTAHYWYDDLALSTDLPMLHIVDAIEVELGAANDASPVGLLGTEATLAADIYPARMAARQSRTFLSLSADDRARLVLPAIDLVKRGRAAEAGRLAEQAVAALRAGGAERIVLACTELPVALAAIQSSLLVHCIDPTRSLARVAVQWSKTFENSL